MIRKMCAADVPQIAALETRCFSDPWSERSVAGELENELSLWFVAVEDETVLGYIGSQSVPPDADVMNLAVAPDARRRGVASALLTALIAALRARGIEKLFLEVRPSNAPALALYRAFGFQELGCRKGYYVNPIEDALILGKELNEC